MRRTYLCFVDNSRDARSAKPLNQRIQLPQAGRVEHRHRALRPTAAEHIRRIGADRAWRAIRQLDHQQQDPAPSLKRPRRQQAPEQRMRLRDHPYVARQYRTQLLQSVAFTPGTGKSHLLIGLGIAAIYAGHKVRYLTAADLVETLYRGLADNTVGKIIESLLRVDLIILDELGFAPLDDTEHNFCSGSSPAPTNADPSPSDHTGRSRNGADSCPSRPPPSASSTGSCTTPPSS